MRNIPPPANNFPTGSPAPSHPESESTSSPAPSRLASRSQTPRPRSPPRSKWINVCVRGFASGSRVISSDHRVCGWDDRIKIKHLQHTHNNGEQKKLNKVYKKRNFFCNSFSGFIGLSYLWKGKGGACGLLGLLSLFFSKEVLRFAFLAMRACMLHTAGERRRPRAFPCIVDC